MTDYRGTEIDLTPTAAMAAEAQRGLDWRAEFNRGGTSVGVARANQLVAREELSGETVRRMVSFFARHEVDKDAEGFSEGEEGFPSAGRIAWQLWGGDTGRAWAERKAAQLDRIDEEADGEKFMTTMQRKAFGAETTTLADKRQVRVICSTPEVDRAGDVVVQEGIDLATYRSNPCVLWMHDPEQPIARCVDIGVVNGKLTATVQFPPEGDDPHADLIYNRIKNGVVNATSIGFTGRMAEPMDPNNPPRYDDKGVNIGGGVKYTGVELAEFSFVSVPAVRGALVIERSATVAVPAAELAALKAAADAPKKLAAEFRALAKAAPKGQRGQILRLANMAEKSASGRGATVALDTKSLWHIGYLASALSELGWIHDCVEDEAEWTNEESAVPAMLADALRQVGTALVALTQEEVADMLSDLSGEEAEAAADKSAPALTVKDVVGALKGKPIAALSMKAGRVLSSANETALADARDKIDGVLQQVASEDEADLEQRAAEIREMEIKAFEASVAA